jgi:hypothetical protein
VGQCSSWAVVTGAVRQCDSENKWSVRQWDSETVGRSGSRAADVTMSYCGNGPV